MGVSRSVDTAVRIARAAAAASLLVCLLPILAAGPVRAQSGHPLWRFLHPGAQQAHPRRLPAQVDPAAAALLQAMLQAEKDLVITGVQVTTLYQPNRSITSVQAITKNGDRAYRMDYQSPPGLAGQVLVDNGQVEWHYFPRRKTIDVNPSRLASLRQRMGPVLRALRQGTLNVQLQGQDQIAGHAVRIVQVSGVGPFAGIRRYWIDPENGAQLKIEIYGPGGQIASTSYYTQVSYFPPLGHAAFAPPRVPADTKVTTATPRQTLAAVPADSQAGFHVLQPAYLPANFKFQTASQTQIGGEPLIGIQYGDGINVLSLYETPERRPQPDKIARPRPGVLLVRSKGIRLIVIGNLAQPELRKIAQSLK